MISHEQGRNKFFWSLSFHKRMMKIKIITMQMTINDDHVSR